METGGNNPRTRQALCLHARHDARCLFVFDSPRQPNGPLRESKSSPPEKARHCWLFSRAFWEMAGSPQHNRFGSGNFLKRSLRPGTACAARIAASAWASSRIPGVGTVSFFPCFAAKSSASFLLVIGFRTHKQHHGNDARKTNKVNELETRPASVTVKIVATGSTAAIIDAFTAPISAMACM